MKNLSLLIITLLTSSSFAMDATRISKRTIFNPDLGRQGLVQSRIGVIEQNTNAAFEIATVANSSSAVTQQAIMGKDSCIYDTGIECTIGNMNYIFNTERWDATDTDDENYFYFTPPEDVTIIYITLRSPRGPYFVYGENSTTITITYNPVGQSSVSHEEINELDAWEVKAPASNTEHNSKYVTEYGTLYLKEYDINLDIPTPILKASYELPRFPTLKISVPGHEKNTSLYADGFVEIKY